ncbi:SigE family RNA polymerase sigma factor [Actinobacteria bacterium YIM 96077]|uniref:SigE family RNA polymerase sigma factor n=1 Tax=Phytoactinopolyspora halophila TaxID=1981511 RepID=A0A329QN42_9ACTN|nr:SigE family RNA polymerase sigma factor [Phytoactinopolyspora halophila]AYY12308.1 SigE family RNA polymerase sigma factor [Actinobacteria bacterium YIM 96077]RAW13774.1 SigE family RNA polymerase sigma factor [Phytoactinopolyspora halophila]
MARSQTRADEFVAYVSARRGYLRRTAYLVCGDWHAAEDLVQTALIKLYAVWPRIHREGAEDAYVRRIIVRAHLDEKRRPWRREKVGLDGFDVAAPEAVSFEDSDALVAAMKTLPERQRATLVLRYWCGLSVEEAASDLNCSTGTVKSHTSRAVANLRAILSTDELAEERQRS